MGLIGRLLSRSKTRDPRAGRSAPEPGLVISRHADALMRMRGVISVGIGKTDDGRAAVVVGIIGDESTARSLPKELDGVPVVVKRTGRIDAL